MLWPRSKEETSEYVPHEKGEEARDDLEEEKSITRLLLVERTSDAEERVDACVMVVPALELVVLIFEVRQAVSWAPDDPEQLGERENEVEDLRNEEEKHRLAKVPKNANNCKSHPSEVAVRVADEYFRGERVVLHQRERGHQEWYDYRH